MGKLRSIVAYKPLKPINSQSSYAKYLLHSLLESNVPFNFSINSPKNYNCTVCKFAGFIKNVKVYFRVMHSYINTSGNFNT